MTLKKKEKKIIFFFLRVFNEINVRIKDRYSPLNLYGKQWEVS